MDDVFKAKIEPTNIVDKYAVCVLLHDRIVEPLPPASNQGMYSHNWVMTQAN